jgi:transposase
VRLVLDEGKTISQVARDLDLTPSALGGWVNQARADRSGGKTGLTTEERAELAKLRKENRELRMERDILKNRRGRRPTCWARSSGRATTGAARKERPAAFWRLVPVKKHGPRSAADLALVTPSGDPV